MAYRFPGSNTPFTAHQLITRLCRCVWAWKSINRIANCPSKTGIGEHQPRHNVNRNCPKCKLIIMKVNYLRYWMKNTCHYLSNHYPSSRSLSRFLSMGAVSVSVCQDAVSMIRRSASDVIVGPLSKALNLEILSVVRCFGRKCMSLINELKDYLRT